MQHFHIETVWINLQPQKYCSNMKKDVGKRAQFSKFLEEKTFHYKNYFQKIARQFRRYFVNVNGEDKNEKTIDPTGEIAEKISHQRSVSFCYYTKSDLEHILPSGCHQFFGDDCKERFVKQMQNLE